MKKREVRPLVIRSETAFIEATNSDGKLLIVLSGGDSALLEREEVRRLRDWLEHEFLDKV